MGRTDYTGTLNKTYIYGVGIKVKKVHAAGSSRDDENISFKTLYGNYARFIGDDHTKVDRKIDLFSV
ncbi:hypothetical protein MNB_SV-10-493 [hydrothermal vent metagenome]|uniref:Uncharacterized protein n=1 Tax=hydrothermal vent metagenome TaxID=652676 RepID=A0A1W1BUH9_9ZZZZ